MDRNRFLKGAFGLSLLSIWGCETNKLETEAGDKAKSSSAQTFRKDIREELTNAWLRSEAMTLTNMEQMPPDLFTFKYTEEAMTFSEQWRHCVVYTCGQLANKTDTINPYKDIKLPVQMPKEDVIQEIRNMYAFVRKTIKELPLEKLYADCDFAGEEIPVWRLLYALENHIIHHRGQCIVYLRLKGITPKGYYGW